MINLSELVRTWERDGEWYVAPAGLSFIQAGFRLIVGNDCQLGYGCQLGFAYRRADFEFQLRTLDAWQRLSQRQVEALATIKVQRLATKEQRQLLYDWECARQSREAYRSTRKLLHSAIRRYGSPTGRRCHEET